jgi:hypothetical protein
MSAKKRENSHEAIMGAFQDFIDESPDIRTDIVLVKASSTKKFKEVEFSEAELLRRVGSFADGTIPFMETPNIT